MPNDTTIEPCGLCGSTGECLRPDKQLGICEVDVNFWRMCQLMDREEDQHVED